MGPNWSPTNVNYWLVDGKNRAKVLEITGKKIVVFLFFFPLKQGRNSLLEPKPKMCLHGEPYSPKVIVHLTSSHMHDL